VTSGETRGSRRRALVALAAAALVGLLAGCQDAGGAEVPVGAAPAAAAGQAAAATTAKISIAPAQDALPVALSTTVSVTATDGTLTTVDVTAPGDVGALEGDISTDRHSWISTGTLRPSTTYSVSAEAVDARGRTTSQTSTFTTAAPAKVLTTEVLPINGSTVGVGIPVIVHFDHPVVNRAAVERTLTVTASHPVVGGWRWVGDSEVHFRPQAYWPANTDVTVHLGYDGVDSGNGVWGTHDRTIRFHVGAAMISRVDVARHTMTVTRNGKVIKVVPITTGKAGFLTRNGIKVVMEKFVSKVMDAQTIGIHPGDVNYYRLTVPYAMRVTNSGEFVHAAPWSVANQGLANVSHGCVGMSMANGRWFYSQSHIGDVIQVVNSPRHLEPGNGWTDWNVPWSQWRQGSALAA
jgi:lipoprotein-anchoring transpeptidase ErfK/SrfK